jgi:ketosteroid isomerase-like protein
MVDYRLRPNSRCEEGLVMPPTKTDLIRKFFAAYASRDRAYVESRMTDDFKFTSPYDDAIDKAIYFERCWPVSERVIKENVLERILEQGDEAFVTYRCTTAKGDEFRNTEFFVFEGDKVRRIDVYFGASYRDGKFVGQPNSK